MADVTIPESMVPFVEAEVAAGGYRDANEYVQSLIRAAQVARERAEIEAKLLVGVAALDRGEATELTAADWDRLRQRVHGDATQPQAS